MESRDTSTKGTTPINLARRDTSTKSTNPINLARIPLHQSINQESLIADETEPESGNNAYRRMPRSPSSSSIPVSPVLARMSLPSAETERGRRSEKSHPRRSNSCSPPPLPITLGRSPMADQKKATTVEGDERKKRSFAFSPSPPASPFAKGGHRRLEGESNQIANNESEKENPFDTANWLSVTFMWWLNRLIVQGAKKPLTDDDIWKAPLTHRSEYCAEHFDPVWKDTQERYSQNKFALEIGLLRVAKRLLSVSGVLFTAYFITQLLTPYFVKAIISYVSFNDEEVSLLGLTSGYQISFLLLVIQLVTVLADNACMTILMRINLTIRNTLIDAIYRKTLSLSSTARQSSTSGEMITLMSVDTDRIAYAFMDIHWLWGAPLVMVIGIILLINYVGVVSGLAALGVMVVLFAVQGIASRLIAKYREQAVKFTEERVKLVNEALRGIRIIKYYSWEESIAERVEQSRRQEIVCLKKLGYSLTMFITFLLIAPTVILLITFIVYNATGEELNVTVVFTTMAFVNVLTIPFNVLPLVVSDIMQSHVSAKRILAWLRTDEIQPIQSHPDDVKTHKPGDITVRQGNFIWALPSSTLLSVFVKAEKGKKPDPERLLQEEEKDGFTSIAAAKSPSSAYHLQETEEKHLEKLDKREDGTHFGFTLKNINLSIPAGSLCVVVGSVGSGKSTLIHALLGQLTQLSGHITVSGNIAYVSQEAWIPHGTLRQSVLFESEPLSPSGRESEEEKKRYEEILDCVQLRVDLKTLPAGDRTEIGEKGINLSGGQKARVSLARALYKPNVDLYLFDDPLSAVDAHVARKIFDDVITKRLERKTRVLVMNSHYSFITSADLVVVMDKGEITGFGPPSHLRESFPQFFIDDDEGNADLLSSKEGSKENSQGDEEIVTLEEEGRAVPCVLESCLIKKESHLAEEEGDGQAGDRRDDGKLIEEEDREFGAVNWNTYVGYFKAIGSCGPLIFLLALSLFVISQASQTITEWWLGVWAQLQYHLSPEQKYITIYICLTVATSVLAAGKLLFFINTMLNISEKIHHKTFMRVLRAPVTTFFDVTPLGRIMNRFSKDMDQIDTTLPEFLKQFIRNLLSLIAAIIVAVLSQPYLILAFIPVAGLFLWAQTYFRKTSREVKRLESISRTPIFSSFGETLTGVGTIRAFRMEEIFTRKNRETVNANTKFLFIYFMSGRWLAIRLDLLAVVVVFLVNIFVCYFRESVNPGLAGLAVNYALILTGTLQWTVRVFILFENNMTSAERILHFGKLNQEGTEGEDGVAPTETRGQWPREGSIEFSNVYMRYRPELPLVLKGVSLKVSAGEKIGICGRTGAGKSSIMLALYRIVELEGGSVSIDGIDLSTVSLESVRRGLAIIPQDPVMFSGTLRYNLDPFDEYDDAKVWEVLDKVHLKAFVSTLEKKLCSEIAEGGENLSVGQRQLVCIARAMLMKTKILIMDEATASVDGTTDAMIQETIRENFADRTVLCIAHRLETIIHCDRIAVIDAGKVAECGPPSTLLKDPQSHFTVLAKNLGEDLYRNLLQLSFSGASVSSV